MIIDYVKFSPDNYQEKIAKVVYNNIKTPTTTNTQHTMWPPTTPPTPSIFPLDTDWIFTFPHIPLYKHINVLQFESKNFVSIYFLQSCLVVWSSPKIVTLLQLIIIKKNNCFFHCFHLLIIELFNWRRTPLCCRHSPIQKLRLDKYFK